ncbi:hypothetical protein G6F22_016927 [Rhizopus arrhizus]|nr:hypothetical protein G6F22_016927 [Rhizopus arrhizus]
MQPVGGLRTCGPLAVEGGAALVPVLQPIKAIAQPPRGRVAAVVAVGARDQLGVAGGAPRADAVFGVGAPAVDLEVQPAARVIGAAGEELSGPVAGVGAAGAGQAHPAGLRVGDAGLVGTAGGARRRDIDVGVVQALVVDFLVLVLDACRETMLHAQPALRCQYQIGTVLERLLRLVNIAEFTFQRAA